MRRVKPPGPRLLLWAGLSTINFKLSSDMTRNEVINLAFRVIQNILAGNNG